MPGWITGPPAARSGELNVRQPTIRPGAIMRFIVMSPVVPVPLVAECDREAEARDATEDRPRAARTFNNAGARRRPHARRTSADRARRPILDERRASVPHLVQ